MILVASVLLLLALPIFLWPLLRPPEVAPPPDAPAEGKDREQLLHSIEEVELDLASGRLDRHEAERRLVELRQAPR